MRAGLVSGVAILAIALAGCSNSDSKHFSDAKIIDKLNLKKSENGYAEIVRWNGKVADFTSLARAQGPEFGVKDGDVVEATIVGDRITSFINGVEVLSTTDDRFANGAPGIGFNFGCGDTYVDHGFTSFEVKTYDD